MESSTRSISAAVKPAAASSSSQRPGTMQGIIEVGLEHTRIVLPSEQKWELKSKLKLKTVFSCHPRGLHKGEYDFEARPEKASALACW